jgi:hypothetical protein
MVLVSPTLKVFDGKLDSVFHLESSDMLLCTSSSTSLLSLKYSHSRLP